MCLSLQLRFRIFTSGAGREDEDMNTCLELSSLCSELGFSAKTLYALSNTISSHYRTKEIEKRSGGTRKLRIPDPLLKSVQRRIMEKLLAYEEISTFATAYRSGADTKKNAQHHIAKDMVMKLDIQSFFDNITFAQVRKFAFPEGKYSEACRTLLTILCYDEERLPQGAPTSPFICNIVMKDFDKTLGEWCFQRNIAYTRYCDDMTFSGSFDAGEVIDKAEELLRREGFFLNPKKTKVIRRSQRQTVTGLTVNDVLSVPRPYRKKIRQEIRYIQRFGLASHALHTGVQDTDAYINNLLGRINYVLSVTETEEFLSYRKYMMKLKKNRILKGGAHGSS